MAFDSRMWGEHGLAYLIETSAGQMLFDTGQTAQVLAHNLAAIGHRLDKLSVFR